MEGINIAGFLTAESGLGTAVRGTVTACQAAGIPYALTDITCTSSRREDTTFANEITNTAPYDISLFHINPDVAKKAAKQVPTSFWKASKCIAYWVCESSVLPPGFTKWARKFDEVWTPSTFTQSIFSEAVDIPVHCVPHAIPAVTPSVQREENTFLCMFDYMSVFERKNPLGAITAFLQAFPTEDVRLIIKCINSALYPKQHQMLLDAISTDNRITVIDTYLSAEDTHQLLASCTALISLHRCEGFGLHLAQAIAAGTPVIATNFGGNTDFMNAENSYCVDYDLFTLASNIGPYPKHSLWAEPDVSCAANHMQSVYEKCNVRTPKIDASFSPIAIGMLITQQLKRTCVMQL